MNQKTLEDFILGLPDTKLDYPFGKDVAVYKTGDKMFALIATDKQPLQLSLKCDPGLAVVLREKYDEIMPGQHLNKKHWNTIVMAGQVPENEIEDFIRHSYLLVTEELTSSAAATEPASKE